MIEELISVIINVYNGEKYISKCLESIINQTYKNLEILIVNDGSTDNTLKICESYNDKRIKIINQEKMGISLARNVGIQNASGKYLFWVDSDDFIEKDMIEYMYNLCKKYNVPLSVCKSMDIYNYNFEVKNDPEKIEIISGLNFLKKILLLQDRTGNVWNKLIKKEIYDGIEFEDRIISDIAVIYKLPMKIDKICCSNQIKYYYLKHDGSITAKKASTERLIDTYDVYINRYNYIKQQYPNLIENNVAVLQIIIHLYLKNNIELEKYLDKKKAMEVYKKIFTFRILKCNIGIREKVKIILFRISPRFNKTIVNLYLKLRVRKKRE